MKKIVTTTKLPYKYFMGNEAKEQRAMVYATIKKELELPDNDLVKIYEGTRNLYLTTHGWEERLMVINLDGGYFKYTLDKKEKIKKVIIEITEAKKLREEKEQERKIFYEKYKSVITTDSHRYFLGDTQYQVKIDSHSKKMSISIYEPTWEERYHYLFVDLNKINEPNHGVIPMAFNFGTHSIDVIIEYANKMREVENKFLQFFNEVMLPKLLMIQKEQIQLA